MGSAGSCFQTLELSRMGDKGHGNQANSSAEGGSQIMAQGSSQPESAEEAGEEGWKRMWTLGPCSRPGRPGRMAAWSKVLCTFPFFLRVLMAG